jgi:hypothetical protein
MKRLLPLVVLMTVLLGACGIANPWPSDPRPSTTHHTLLVIGDSLAGQTDATLPDVLAGKGLPTTIIDAHQNGSGLIGPVGSAPDALTYVQDTVGTYPQADTVLIEWAGACAVCDTPGYPTYGSSQFFAQWTAVAHSIIDFLHTQQVTVVWVVSPPLGVDTSAGASGSQVRVQEVLALSYLTKVDLAPYASTGVVDWFTAVSDTDNRYQTDLYYDGALHTVRASDLVHFTRDGSLRASTWTAHGLGELWATLPPPPDVSIQRAQRLIQAGDPVTLDVHGGL